MTERHVSAIPAERRTGFGIPMSRRQSAEPNRCDLRANCSSGDAGEDVDGKVRKENEGRGGEMEKGMSEERGSGERDADAEREQVKSAGIWCGRSKMTFCWNFEKKNFFFWKMEEQT